MLVIIDELTNQVIKTVNTTGSVDLPGGMVVLGAAAGARATNENETGIIASYLFLEPSVVAVGVGNHITDDPPVYDAVAGTATISRVHSGDPRPIAEQRADKVIAVRVEAERRIADGTLVGGVQFHCDDRSIGRISGMMVSAQRGALPIIFKTQAGNTVTIGTALEAEALFDAASAHVAAMLAASSALQDTINLMDAAAIAALDISAAIHW